MSIIYKAFFSILFIIFSTHSVKADQNSVSNCNKFTHINKELKIEKINIEIKKNGKSIILKY